MSIDNNSRSIDKESVLKEKPTNIFFKFGNKNWQIQNKT